MTARVDEETTCGRTAADEYTVVWSCLPKDLRALEKDDRFEQVAGGVYADGLRWGRFRIPSDQWSVRTGAKRRTNLSAEQRAAMGARLRESREASS